MPSHAVFSYPFPRDDSDHKRGYIYLPVPSAKDLVDQASVWNSGRQRKGKTPYDVLRKDHPRTRAGCCRESSRGRSSTSSATPSGE